MLEFEAPLNSFLEGMLYECSIGMN